MAREKDPNKQIDDRSPSTRWWEAWVTPTGQADLVAGARPDGKVIYAGARVGSAAQQPEWKIAPLSARVVYAHVYIQQSMEPRECDPHLTFVEATRTQPSTGGLGGGALPRRQRASTASS